MDDKTMIERSNKDRLLFSELPNEILVHILSFLPIKDAIRTIQISSFGQLWTWTPTLKLYNNNQNFIDNVIKYHQSPTIDVFNLKFVDHRVSLSQKKFNEWIHFALTKKPKVLKVTLNLVDSRYLVLHPGVLQSQCVVKLHIDSMIIKSPTVVSMGSLTTLKLYHVVISDTTFQAVVTRCPYLQELSIRFPIELRKLHFSSPTLETLNLDLFPAPQQQQRPPYSLDCPNLKFLCVGQVFLDDLEVIDVSSLREASFKECYNLDQDRNISFDCFEMLLDKFQNVEFFQHGGKSCIQLKHCGDHFDEKLDSLCNSWTHIALRPGFVGSCLTGIYRLLRNSLMLEELIIYATEDFKCDCYMLLLQEVSLSFMMQRLKTVSVREYEKPCKALLQLIEFLLSRAPALEKLVFTWNRKDLLYSIEAREFGCHLMSFPKASPNVRYFLN